MKRRAVTFFTVVLLALLAVVLTACNSILGGGGGSSGIKVDTATAVTVSGTSTITFTPTAGQKYVLEVSPSDSLTSSFLVDLSYSQNSGTGSSNPIAISGAKTIFLANDGTGDFTFKFVRTSGPNTIPLSVTVAEEASLATGTATSVTVGSGDTYLSFTPETGKTYSLDVNPSSSYPNVSVKITQGSDTIKSSTISSDTNFELPASGTGDFIITLSAPDGDSGTTVSCALTVTEKMQAVMYFKYTNVDGNTPVYALDTSLGTSSSLVTYTTMGTAEDTSGTSNTAMLKIDNVSLIDKSSSTNYTIDKIVADESTDGGKTWYSDPELPATAVNQNSTAVVLVLDTTTSLNANGVDGFSKVKSYADAAIDTISSNTQQQATIGLVAFGVTIRQTKLTTDYYSLKTIISNYQLEDKTRLYDAVDAAEKMITDPSVTAKSKAIIVFTDGRDNASTNTETQVVNELKAASDLKTLVIGEGALADASELAQLAVNGTSQVVTDVDAAQKVFNAYSEAVSNVYTVTFNGYGYTTQVTDSNPLYIKLVMDISPK